MANQKKKKKGTKPAGVKKFESIFTKKMRKKAHSILKGPKKKKR